HRRRQPLAALPPRYSADDYTDDFFQPCPRYHRGAPGIHSGLRRHGRRTSLRDLVLRGEYLLPGVPVLQHGLRGGALLALRYTDHHAHVVAVPHVAVVGLLRRRRVMAGQAVALPTSKTRQRQQTDVRGKAVTYLIL